ncbi:hypothetical protein [Streptomyces sp. NPDC048282]|uniref:hypothetical protein n=1 Tax=Streptomyces sp. NPDC048282 TaxID=3365528 RepID=UPI00371C10B5
MAIPVEGKSAVLLRWKVVALKDPRDRATGPGAWPTLPRSVDTVKATTPPRTGAKMTLRVYTVDQYGTVTADRGTVEVQDGEELPPVTLASAFSPCACPHHRTGQAVAL